MSNIHRFLPLLCLIASVSTCSRYLLDRQAEKVYYSIVLEPMDDYNDAMRAYLDCDYRDAMWKFGIVHHKFPNFHLDDKSLFHLGMSLFYQKQFIAADSIFTLGMLKGTPKPEVYYNKNVIGKMKCAFVHRDWETLTRYANDSSAQKNISDYYRVRVNAYKAIGTALMASPNQEDTIITVIETVSDDYSLINDIHYMKLTGTPTTAEDQLSLLEYLLQYPQPEFYPEEKAVLLSRFNFYRESKDIKKLDNFAARKSLDELIVIIKSID